MRGRAARADFVQVEYVNLPVDLDEDLEPARSRKNVALLGDPGSHNDSASRLAGRLDHYGARVGVPRIHRVALEQRRDFRKVRTGFVLDRLRARCGLGGDLA
jgi:hypothetical protein